MKEKNFGKCTLDFLDTTFGLEQADTLPILEEWLAVDGAITATEKIALLDIQAALRFNVHDWNEVELITNFIGPLFQKLKIFSKKYNFFSVRDVEATLQGRQDEWRLYGKPDGMIAAGRRLPRKPYFMFNEYKKDTDSDGDPSGQVLSAMLAGQQINGGKRPIFGCYVVGQNWYFMVLHQKEYTISAAYSALSNDIFLIFNILKRMKNYTEQFIVEDEGAM